MAIRPLCLVFLLSWELGSALRCHYQTHPSNTQTLLIPTDKMITVDESGSQNLPTEVGVELLWGME